MCFWLEIKVEIVKNKDKTEQLKETWKRKAAFPSLNEGITHLLEDEAALFFFSHAHKCLLNV